MTSKMKEQTEHIYDPNALLEQALIEEYLHSKGYSWEGLKKLRNIDEGSYALCFAQNGRGKSAGTFCSGATRCWIVTQVVPCLE